MPEQNNNSYIWRCAKCSCHFATILKAEGLIKQEKKCPKCKAVNVMTLSNKEIMIHCKLIEAENEMVYNEDFSNRY